MAKKKRPGKSSRMITIDSDPANHPSEFWRLRWKGIQHELYGEYSLSGAPAWAGLSSGYNTVMASRRRSDPLSKLIGNCLDEYPDADLDRVLRYLESCSDAHEPIPDEVNWKDEVVTWTPPGTGEVKATSFRSVQRRMERLREKTKKAR